MSLETTVYYVLALSAINVWQCYRLERMARDTFLRLGRMMTTGQHEAEIAEFRDEIEERDKTRKRVMVGIAVVAGALAVA
jgi:hypothetical protein